MVSLMKYKPKLLLCHIPCKQDMIMFQTDQEAFGDYGMVLTGIIPNKTHIRQPYICSLKLPRLNQDIYIKYA